MKNRILIMAGILSLSSLVSAQNLTQQSVDKARAVIDQVIEAYGGRDKLNQLNSVAIDFETTNLAVNQSRKPGPPWDENKLSGSTMVDFEKQQFVTQAKSETDRQAFNNGTVINGDQSYQLNFRANSATPIAEPNFLNTAGPFIRVTPALLVKQLMQRQQTSHYLGQTDVDGRPHDVITLVMEVGPSISLYFDQETRLLNKSERYLPPFGMVGYRFHDYKKVSGIPFNDRFELFVNGDNNMQRTNTHARVNPPVDQHTHVHEGMTVGTPIQPDPLKRQEIDKGVYLIGGTGTYAMFVEMDDHVIAVGGTAGIPDRIALLKEVIPNKPIKFGIMTHHHNDHIVGAQAYADEGTTVIAAAAHEAVIREATENKALKIETVDDKRTFKSKGRELRVIDVGPTNHSEHLLVAYLPKEGILFEADHFGLQAAGNINPANPATQDFAKNLKAKKIKAKKILSAHSSLVATKDDLAKAVKMGKDLDKK